VPTAVVETVGGVAVAVPPVALVPYQFKIAPEIAVAVKVADWPTVTFTGDVTTGAAGGVQAAAAVTITLISDLGPSQSPVF